MEGEEAARSPNGQNIHAVTFDAWHDHTTLLVVVRVAGVTLDGRAHAKVVVFTESDEGQPPQLRHVHRFPALPQTPAARDTKP
jgi:hypothetical protein